MTSQQPLSDEQIVEQLKQTLTMTVDSFGRRHAAKDLLACFSGAFDSNQTRFDSASNLLQIGVIANSKKEGRQMLAILRAIIDDDLAGLMIRLIDAMAHSSKFLDALAQLESEYFSSFPVNGQYVSKLVDGQVHSTIHNSDLWTAARLRTEFLKLLEE